MAEVNLSRRSTPAERISHEERVSLALARMAIRRQAAPLSDLDYAVYNEDLAQFPVEDVEAVCMAIGRQERADGETAMPSIGRLVNRCKNRMRVRREWAENAHRDAELKHMKDHPELYSPFDFSEEIKRWTLSRSLPSSTATH